jgi:hypothetical protein
MRSLACSLFCALALSTAAMAYGELPGTREAPHFEGADGTVLDALPLQSQRTIVDVAGVVGRVRVEQVYRNDGTKPLEATYVFPTSSKLAVHDMRIQVGDDRALVAEIRAKETAQQIFDAARNEGQTAGLLKQHRPNVVSMHLTNMMPGELITVFVEASELITPIDGIYELVLPHSMGPRFTGNPGSEAFVENTFMEGATSAERVPGIRPEDGEVTGTSSGQFIVINDTSRNWALRDAEGTVLDGPTVSHTENQSRERNVPVGPAGSGTSWTNVSASRGLVPGPTPGGGQPEETIADNGCYISELADAVDVDPNTAEVNFEFIEIHCPSAPGN